MKNTLSTRSLVIAFALLIVLSASIMAQDNAYADREIKPVGKDMWRTESKSQGRTGTCWCFATTSFLESEFKRLGVGEVHLSEIFTVFNAYQEKAMHYIRMNGNNNFSQGGLSHDLLHIIPRYGLVQKSDYTGLLEGQTGHNHSAMVKELTTKVQEIDKAQRSGITENWREEVVAILSKHLGPVPEKVKYNGKEYTPKEFAKNVLKFNPHDYVEFTSYSYMPFWHTGALLVSDNWLRYSGYYNIPLDNYMEIVDHALANGFSIAIDLDVSERGTRNSELAYVYLDEDVKGVKVDQGIRDKMYDSGSTTDDHLIHVVGTGVDQDGNKFYLAKDSGGPTRWAKYKGHYYISENYFRGKVLGYMLHKDGIPKELREKLRIN